MNGLVEAMELHVSVTRYITRYRNEQITYSEYKLSNLSAVEGFLSSGCI